MPALKPGDTASRTLTITDDTIRTFADLTGDHNPVHLDEVYAAGTRFGRRIAHGIIAAGVISATLAVRVQDIVNTFRHEFYLVEGPGHREHLACKHAKKLVFSRILGDFCYALKFGSTNLFTMS
ncbi:MAG: MaoC/PaaZ C-terminal domain-containing protein [Chloroflexota bacterium]